MNRIREIEERLGAIAAEIDSEGADIDALTEEVRRLKEEKRTLEEQLEKRSALRREVAGGAGTVTRSLDTSGSAAPEPWGVDTPEYRSVWLRRMQGRQLSEVEQRAYDTAGGAISTLTANAIMEVVRDHAPLLERMSVVYGSAAMTYYVEGTNNDAEEHTENAQITPAEDTLTKVELKPAEITKMVQISDAARAMSVPAFEAWLSKSLGEAIARKINDRIISAVAAAASSAGTGFTTADVQTLLGSVKGDSLAVLCSRKTLYTKLLPLQDTSKSSIVRFDGGAVTVYGVPVLVDDHVAENTVLAGDLSKAVAEMAEDVTIRSSYDIDTNSYKYLGVALFDTKVGLASAFAKLAAA